MKKTLRRLAPVALVLVALTTLSFMAKDGITLRLKPQQGKTYTITSKANMMMMMEVQGQTMNQSQVMETRQSFTPKSVTATETLIETQIEALKMTISQMGMKLEYDSEHPEKTSPMLAGQTAEMDKVIKKLESVKYDNMGHIVDSLNLEMSQLNAAIIQLPEQELSVGSKWSSNKHQSVNGTEMDVNMEYTVTAISKKSVDVSFTGNVESSDDVTGTYNGTASIDPKTGLMTASTTKSNLSMTLSQQGLNIPVTMVGTTTVEVK